MRYRVRMVEFTGQKSYTQGYGMEYDDIVLDVEDGETIAYAEAGYTSRGAVGMDGLRALMRLWLITPTDEDPTKTDEEAKAEEVVAVPPQIHTEVVVDHRGFWSKIRDAFRHQHYPVYRQWTLDDSTWESDQNALEVCSCGARKRMWGGTW